MDRLEAWKIDLTNRPVLDEMSKVKQLNMTGQTEELFERWRTQWDELVTVKLPDLEELLFDAEEYIDRYRFRKAKDVQQNIEKKLLDAEEQIKDILNELNELIGSEEKNRVVVDQLKEEYREAKKNLLVYRHSYGTAENRLENQLNEVVAKFQEYEEKTENGNYLEARETVLFIKNQLEIIKYNMDVIPQLLSECQSILPAQLAEVQDGFLEMMKQGYYLDHIQLDSEINELENELNKYLDFIEETNIINAEDGIQEIKARIDILCDLLEKEVHARNFVIQNEKITKELLHTIQEENEQLSLEVVQVQQSYHLAESDFETQRQLEKSLTSLYKRFESLCEQLKNNDAAQTMVREELTKIKEQLDNVQDEQQNFFARLQALRKDEFEAREKIKELSKKVSEAVRQISKSNVPGIPEDYKYLFQDGKESIENVKRQLEEKPLNITVVNQYLEIAVLTVEKLVNTTIEMVENVALAEKVIQYGNRYRSQFPSVSNALMEAEKAFRSYDYQKALEQAATSIQAIDPGAIKKIEILLSKELSIK